MVTGLVGLFWLLLRLGGSWFNQQVLHLSDELVLLLGAALVSGAAILFHAVGASEAVAAFICGVLAAGLGLRERFEHLFGSVRDLGVALFFLTVGAKALGLLEARVAGLSLRRSSFAAVYLVPRGEFNLILGAMALQQGYPLVGQVAVLLVLVSIPLGSLLMRFAPSWYDKRRK